jgi:hypothetical protein
MAVQADINYLAVLVCAILSMGLSAFWYGPFLFGKLWIDSIDKTDDEVKREINPLLAYTLTFMGHFVMAYILARFMLYSEAVTLAAGVRIAFMGWAGFTAATMLINTVFEGSKFKKLVVDCGYHLILFLLYGIILALWQP